MKLKLRYKYVLSYYQQCLLDQWQGLKQEAKSVKEFISQFDECALRCGLDEPKSVTLSRFRDGLRDDIKRKLYLRGVDRLEDAYQTTENYKRFQRSPLVRRPEPFRPNNPNFRPDPTYQGRSTFNQSRPNPNPNRPNKTLSRPNPNSTHPNFNPTHPNPSSSQSSASNVVPNRSDKGKAPTFQKNPSPSPNACFRCNKVGHFASQCPTRSLHIGELEEDEPEPNEDEEQEVYEVEIDLIEEYEGEEEDFDQSDLIGIVRCILSQTKTQKDWHRTNIL